MLNGGLQLALAIFALQATCILVVARAGHSFGVSGATAAALSLWFVFAGILYFSFYEPGLQFLLITALLVSIVFLLPLMPVLVAAKFHWLKGRILIGLAGAAVIAWLISPNYFSNS